MTFINDFFDAVKSDGIEMPQFASVAEASAVIKQLADFPDYEDADTAELSTQVSKLLIAATALAQQVANKYYEGSAQELVAESYWLGITQSTSLLPESPSTACNTPVVPDVVIDPYVGKEICNRFNGQSHGVIASINNNVYTVNGSDGSTFEVSRPQLQAQIDGGILTV